MSKLYEIHCLEGNKSDISTLTDIYKLRVKSWEETGVFNSIDYPNGWHDELDKSAVHFFVKKDGILMSAARVNILSSISQIPISRVYQNNGYDSEKNIGYISRNVVHPDFRGMGLSKIMDIVRLNYLNRNNIQLCFADANQKRMETLLSYNFEIIGKIPVNAKENYKKDPNTYIMVKKATLLL